MNKTKIRGKFLITIFSCLMIISIAYGLSLEDLTDHTIYDNQSNICTASNLGMNIDVYPCNVQDIDGKNIQQNVDFKWEGVSPQDTSWVFVYDGEIESGKIEVETNQSYEVQEYENTWITNYTLNNVNNTDDLTPNYTINETFILPNGICDLGNENNTQIFNVTYDEISTENGTIQESELVCFTSNIGYSISGNYDKLVNNTKYRNIWTDQTNKISFMGNNLLGDGMSFYKVQNITFQPNQTIKTKWTYTPKDKAETGKWSILGYPSSLSIQDAINQELYIFLDPWWNSSWSYYKQYTNLTGNITYLEINRTLNDNADWNDTRFISCDNSTELNFTLEAEIGTYGQFRVNNLGQSCFYRYYGNAGATSTSSASNTYFNPVSAYYFDANANDFVGSNDATIHGTTSLENG